MLTKPANSGAIPMRLPRMNAMNFVFGKLAASALGIASQILGSAVFFLVLAQAWPPAVFGTFSYYFAVGSLLVLVVDYGYPIRVLREVPLATFRNRIDLVKGYAFKSFVAGMLLLGAILVVALGVAPEAFLIILAAMMLRSFGEYFGSHLRALGRHGDDSAAQLASNVVLAAGTKLACMELGQGFDVLHASVLLLVSRGVYLALNYPKVAKAFQVPLSLPRMRVKSIFSELRRGAVFAGDILVLRSYGVIDVILVNYFLGSAAVGLYQTGQRMLQGFLPFGAVLSNVFLPILARSRGQSSATVTKLVLLAAAVASGCFLFFVFWAPVLVNRFFPPAYAAVVSHLWLFGVLGGVRFMSVPAGVILTARGLQRMRFAANVVALTTTLLSALVAVPLFGLQGMLFALLASNILLLALYCLVMLYARE